VSECAGVHTRAHVCITQEHFPVKVFENAMFYFIFASTYY